MKPFNVLLSGYGTTVFETMSALAERFGAINLGQGFPDEDGPAGMKEAVARATMEGPNQYPRMLGVPALREAVADHDNAHYGLDADASQVMVTSGATEALAACLLALINPGDEVVVIEPLYDTYVPVIRLAGGVPRRVRLHPPAWRLDAGELEAAFSARTSVLVLNSPMNPTGKVFSREELGLIASMLERYDARAVCDEVYEHLVFDDAEHVPLMSLPGMRGRCARIGSAGKTFSFTGWKVGYVTAAPDMLSVIGRAHQYLTFTTAPNLQQAVAHGLRHEQAHYRALAGSLASRRDLLADGLARLGLEPLHTAGTYFLCADIRPLGEADDEAFCKRITEHAGVAAVPMSAFYTDEPLRHLVRFAFCKREEVLQEAVQRLERGLARGAAPGGNARARDYTC